MVLKTCLLVLCMEAIRIHSQLFCDNPVIDSAVTIQDVTYLFRDNSFWIWNHSSNYIEPKPSPINETFTAMFQEDVNDQMHRLNQIDSMFLTEMRLSDGTVDPSRQLLYIFTKKEYFFFSVQNCSGMGLCFSILSSADWVSIPNGWKYYGGMLSKWFSESIGAAFPVGPNIILFYNGLARFVKINPGSNESWPPPHFIDDIFEIPFTEELVLTDGSNYCRFKKALLDVTPDPSKPLETQCGWRPTKSLFLCEVSATTKPPPTTTSTEPTTVTEPQTIAPVNETEMTQLITEESTLNAIESEINSTSDIEESDDSVKQKNNLMTLFFVLIFLGLIIVIIVIVIVVAYCVVGSKKRKKYNTSGSSIRLGKSSSASSNSVSMATIDTVDTNTGEPRDSNS